MTINDQIQEFTRGPHNHLLKVSGIAKAAAKASSDPDEKTLTSYISQLGDPDSPDDDYGNADALADSHQLRAHLALCKIAPMQGNAAKLNKHLDKALEYHGSIHGALHAAAARASEMDPNAIRDEQD